MPNAVITGSPAESIADDLQELNKLDEVVEEPKKEESEPEVEEPEKEEPVEEPEEEIEEEPKKEDEEEIKEEESLELASGKERPAFKAIKEKYPNLFKDFPELREMYFREAKYTEIYPTVDEAKEAKEKSDDYSYLESLVAKGTPESTKEFLDVMKENDENTYKGYVASFLPALAKADSDTYFAITLPIIDGILKSAYREGESNGNESLKGAALWLSKFVFGETSYAKGEKSAKMPLVEKKTDPEKEKFEKEKQEFYSKRATEFESNTTSTATKRLSAIIEKDLDPKDEFTYFEKEHMRERILQEIGNRLEKDSTHMSRINGLWKQAARSGFSEESKDRIISAYLSRAKVILPEVRKEIRALAKGKKAPASNEVRKELTGVRTSSNNRTPGKVDYKKMSDKDILDGKY